MIALLIVCLFHLPSQILFADDNTDQATPQIQETLQATTEQVSATLDEARSERLLSRFFVLLNYSPLDLIIPSKYGLSLGMVRHVDQSFEFEYLHGSVSLPFIMEDIGQMSDDRLSLISRSYFGGNSFNLSYGLSYFDFTVHLGSEYLNQLSQGYYPSVDLVKIQSLGFNVAIGNRWVINRFFTFGVDWISLEQPIVATKKQANFLDYARREQDKETIREAIKFISYFPRFTLFKLQAGLSF